MSWKSSMNNALEAINQQYADINNYYDEADKDFETQFSSYRGQSITDAINSMAQNDVFESPASERALNRTRQGLTEQYATAKSTLAGQKASALGSVTAQKVGYYQNLASLQMQQRASKRSGMGSLFSAIGGIGGTLIGGPAGGMIGASVGSGVGSI